LSLSKKCIGRRMTDTQNTLSVTVCEFNDEALDFTALPRAHTSRWRHCIQQQQQQHLGTHTGPAHPAPAAAILYRSACVEAIYCALLSDSTVLNLWPCPASQCAAVPVHCLRTHIRPTVTRSLPLVHLPPGQPGAPGRTPTALLSTPPAPSPCFRWRRRHWTAAAAFADESRRLDVRLAISNDVLLSFILTTLPSPPLASPAAVATTCRNINTDEAFDHRQNDIATCHTTFESLSAFQLILRSD